MSHSSRPAPKAEATSAATKGGRNGSSQPPEELPDDELQAALVLLYGRERGESLFSQIATDREPRSPDELREETASVLDNVRSYICSYVALSTVQADLLALWTLHTWAIEASTVTPYVHLNSAEPASGKTRTLEVLDQLVARPWFTGRTTAAALPRKIAQSEPTLLLDESDAAFRGEREYAEALRGILNTGYRRGGQVTLCVTRGREIDVVDFPTFCPKAIAGLGALPDTVASRSIQVSLKRRAPTERVSRFGYASANERATPLRERLETWTPHAVEMLSTIEVDDLIELADRAAEVWRPLLEIAAMAGPAWSARARHAALTFSGKLAVEVTASAGIQLLTAIRKLFDDDGDRDHISTDALLKEINADEELPFGGYGRSDALSPRALAEMLRPFEVRPKTIRIADRTPAGLLHSDFEDADTLPPSVSQRATAATSATRHVSATRKRPSALGCCGCCGCCRGRGEHRPTGGRACVPNRPERNARRCISRATSTLPGLGARSMDGRVR